MAAIGSTSCLAYHEGYGIFIEAEGKVFEVLDGVEPNTEVPWAAEKALERLKEKSLLR